MSDYTQSKSGPGALFPDNAVDTSGWNRLEPLITPAQVKRRHLFGIPMVSGIKDPLTKKAQVYDDELIQDTIERAVSMAEDEAAIDIFPVRVKEKHGFKREDYLAFGYMRLERRPAASVEALSITPANGMSLYNVPLDWIETGYLSRGQINIVPITSTVAFQGPAPVGSGGALFLQILGQQGWVPGFWQVEYTSGYPDGQLPRVINELVGVIAAMEVLGSLAATYAGNTSHSLGIDGMSQSVSTPGGQIYGPRMEELAAKRKKLAKQIKSEMGQVLFSSDI